MKKLSFTFKNNEYEIKYKNLTMDKFGRIDTDEMEVMKNGKPENEDILVRAIARYVNGDKSYEFSNVPEEIKKLKDLFYKEIIIDGIAVPLYHYVECFDKKFAPKLQMVGSKDTQYRYYVSVEDLWIMTDRNGSVLSDIEPFVVASMKEEYTKALYIEDETKKWLDSL